MKKPRCVCGHAISRHRTCTHLQHERGRCTECTCAEYAPADDTNPSSESAHE